LLRQDRNYITVRGYFNGSDSWVASRNGPLCRPVNLVQALAKGLVEHDQFHDLFHGMRRRLASVGYDGGLLKANDMIVAVDAEGAVLRGEDGAPQLRLCNFELLRLIPACAAK
jgi:hypothetical protein